MDKLTAAAETCLRQRPPAPTPAALLELHTLAGARRAPWRVRPCAKAADGLFGAEAVADGWYADGGLRSRVRRLVQRGKTLMCGGYRRLAQLESLKQGRSAFTAKRP